MPVPRARLVVLVSGLGSNLQALLEAARDPAYGADVVAVGADRSGILGLERARAASLPTFVVRLVDYPDRLAWDRALLDAVAAHEPTLVVSAGFMKVLGPDFVTRWPVINTHPALLPAFPGAHAVRDALAYGVKVTGCTVHLADTGVDTGPVLAQAAVEVRPDDDEERLHERIKHVERALLVETVGRVCRDGYHLEGRKAVMV